MACTPFEGLSQMLLKLSKKIADCYAHAAENRRRAEQAADPALRAEFLDLEQRWIRLAQSCEFVESVERFLLSARTAQQEREAD